ncbi:MAG: hypothetical protein IPN86_20110 [Saprospiraceae bacterium]|nr:hypothetical protein [Saprospiraceae bacterium]
MDTLNHGDINQSDGQQVQLYRNQTLVPFNGSRTINQNQWVKIIGLSNCGIDDFQVTGEGLEILMHLLHHFQSLGLQLQLPKSKTTKPISHGCSQPKSTTINTSSSIANMAETSHPLERWKAMVQPMKQNIMSTSTHHHPSG